MANPDTLTIIALIGTAALAYGIGRIQERFTRLTERIKKLEANYGHTAVGRARQDVAEEFAFQQALLKNDIKIMIERLKYMDQVAQANMHEPPQ